MFKLVKESLNFKRESDPYASIGVGTRELIKQWLDKYKIKDYIINDNLTIDVLDSVVLEYNGFNEFPEYIQFNIVDGYFSCSHNNLTSLRGCPKEVKGSFYCEHNNLSSLRGCPKIVRDNIYCYNNARKFTEEEVRKYCKVRGSIIV